MYHDTRFREYKVYQNELHQGKKLKSMNEYIYIYIYIHIHIYISFVKTPTHKIARCQNIDDYSLNGMDICIEQIYIVALISGALSATRIPVSSECQLI